MTDRRGGCRTRRLGLLAAVAGVALAMAGCSGKSSPGAGSGGGGGAAASVSADTVRRTTVPVDLRVVGSVVPENSVEVRALVGGELLRVGFKEGDDVRRGDLLFVVDPGPYQAALDQAEGNLARDAARAASDAVDARRYADLVGKDYVTRQQAEDAEATAQASRATLRSDSAAVENARLNLGYCTIRSPIAGRTGSLLLEVGNLVKANSDNPLVVIHQIEPIEVSFSVPERRLPEIRRRDAQGELPVDAVLPSDSTRVHHGRLTFIDNAVDPSTGTILLKATFPNEDRALWPGQFVRVTIRLGDLRDTLVVPSTAVQPGQNGNIVFVIKPDHTVEMRPVKTGEQVDGQTVVEEGLKEGETVVTDGQMRLYPGASVSIKPAVGSEAGRP